MRPHKANWNPFEYNREASIANAIVHNIDAATDLLLDMGIYTDEQVAELRNLEDSVQRFQGYEPGRISQLMNDGYTTDEAAQIANDETRQYQKERWGVK